MYHKFKDYNRNEQREIVFELIRQKYLYDPQLNNFGNNTKYLIGLVKDFQSDQITASDLKERLEFFYSKLKKDKDVADEIYYYFYNIAEVNAEKGNKKFTTICNIIKNIIDVDSISNSIQVPEEKMDKLDNNGGSFMMQTFRKYPAPAGYTPPPPPPPMHNFKNPYTSKDFKSICDYVRYKIFDEIIDNKIETLEDLENLDPAYSFMPDSDEFINFPQCEDEDGEKEDLDFENPGDFIINNENSITFGGGGDWQEPQTFSFRLEKNGKVKAFDIEDGYSDNENYDAEGIIKIISKLFGLNRKDYNPNSTNPNDLVKLYNDMVANKDFKLNPEPKSTTKIETKDCVIEIINYFQSKKTNPSSPLLDSKSWKRLSKTGSKDNIKREFENRKTGDKVVVMSTETEILDIIEVNPKSEVNPTLNKLETFENFDDLINEFPYKEVFEFATVYRKEKPYREHDVDEIDKKEMKEDGYKKFTLSKDTRIAIGEQNWDNGDAEISEIIVITSDTYYWNYDGGWISDGIITIELEKNKGYVPAQEPVDLLETGYENGGGGEIPNKKQIKKMVEKYKLDHVLMSM